MGSVQSTSCEKLWVSCSPKNGDFQDNGNFNELRNDTITVLEIGHYRELSNVGGSMILHDYVGFLVSFENLRFLIKAEKSMTGISVTRPIRWGSDVVPRYVCENLEDCGEIRMEDLLAILQEPSPDYHLLSDNCRSYADATFKQVITRFSETPSLSPERRSYLASFLNNPSPLMPDEVLGYVGARGAGGAAAVGAAAIGAAALGAAAVGAAVVAPTTLLAQVATFHIALRCAGFPIPPAVAQNALHTFIAAQAYAPQAFRALQAYQGGVHTISATQAVTAPLITRAFLYLAH